jgi:hypothetical protein
MAQKPPFSASSSPRPAPGKPVSTAQRGTPIPRPQAIKPQITHEQIAKRAYEIYASGKGGSQVENWLRAERELKNQ